MKFIYVTDLHGWETGYRHVLSTAKSLGIELIVNGGDMWPKGSGIYERQKKFIKKFLTDHFKECADHGIRYFGMPGNDDLKSRLPYWTEACDKTGAKDISFEPEYADGYTFAGFNHIPDVPFGLKDWCLLEKWGERPHDVQKPVISTDKGFQAVENLDLYFSKRPTMELLLANRLDCADAEKFVLVCHVPPAGVGLATIEPGGEKVDVGSTSVHDWIASRQPLLTLHGHIHENYEIEKKFIATVGKTVCIQPGQDKCHEGRITYVVVDTDDPRRASYRIDEPAYDGGSGGAAYTAFKKMEEEKEAGK
jgi:Icc-related predicted phosphoesterase